MTVQRIQILQVKYTKYLHNHIDRHFNALILLSGQPEHNTA